VASSGVSEGRTGVVQLPLNSVVAQMVFNILELRKWMNCSSILRSLSPS